VSHDVYTAYGVVAQYGQNWSLGSSEANFDGPLYCGYFYDTDTHLYQDRNRYYDPGLSTFINRDPIGYQSGNNLYEYCGDNPVNSTDPTGLANVWNPLTWGLSNPSQGWSGFFNPLSAESTAAVGGYVGGVGSGLKNLGKGVVEPVLVVADVPHLTYAWAAGYTIEDVEPWSMWGQYSKQRQLQGNTAWQTLGEGTPPLAANVVTLGWYGYGSGAYEYYQTGDPTAWQIASSGPLLSSLALKGMLESSVAPVAATGGRLGSASTRAQVAEIQAELESRGWTVTHGGAMGEEYIPGPGGARLGSAYPDITAVKNGRTLRINTIDTLSDGLTPTAREAANAAKIRRLTGEHLLPVPKP
jgi:RHS repeat-associated protein